MTAGEIQDMIVRRLVKTRGGTGQEWRRCIGQLRVYAMDTHPHCNWDVFPSGTVSEKTAVNAEVDYVRSTHPHITDT